jgi:hypothetical protein
MKLRSTRFPLPIVDTIQGVSSAIRKLSRNGLGGHQSRFPPTGLLKSNVENPQEPFENEPVQPLWVVVDTALPLCTLEQIGFGQSVMIRSEISQ